MIVFLIGFMGSGKSFYAKGLAGFLKVPMVDLDEYIERREGIPISKIFENFGEQSFRAMESAAVKEVYATLLDEISEKNKNNTISGIVSCGGGTPCFNENMVWMNEHGHTVWINPPEDVICERLKKESATRPLVANLSEDLLPDFVHERMQERKSFYSMAKSTISDPNVSIVQFLKLIEYAKNVF